MSKINDGGSVFPIVIPGFVYADGSSESPILRHQGLTLRDYFAAKAMQGLLTRMVDNIFDPRSMSEDAYDVADAMLTQRTKHEAESDG